MVSSRFRPEVSFVSRRAWLKFFTAITTSSVIGYLALVGAQVWADRPLGVAAGLTLIPVALWTSAAVLVARSTWSGWMPSRRRRLLHAGLWAAMLGTVAVLLLTTLRLGPGPVAVAGIAVTGAGLVAYRRTVTTAMDRNMRIPQAVFDLDGVDDAIAASRRQLADPTMTPAQQAVVKFNLACSLTNREAVSDDPAALLEAAGLLDELLADPAVDLPMRSLVVMELCGTKSMLAGITGSEAGWQDALDELLAIARQLPDDANGRSAVMRAHDEQVQFYLYQMSEVGAGPDGEMPPEWDAYLDAALDSVQRALDVAPPRAELRPILLMERGLFISYRDLDAGIAEMQEAFEQVRHLAPSRRQGLYLPLAQQLLTRARLRAEEIDGGPDTAELQALVEQDLDRAEELATELFERTDLLVGQAAETLAEVSRLRAELLVP